MSERFREYHAAYDYARAQATRLHMDHAIRRVREYGKGGFNVSIANHNDSDYARAEIVPPDSPTVERRI